ncbi:NRAMP family divalent metal transporter [Inquilinus sp. YAF38]|uniref:NRAMP family divalent metal transporter n=1 Tax=Inquilinus sp. YAF38 TaxID=3233084 RepID=UPI003F8F2E5F
MVNPLPASPKSHGWLSKLGPGLITGASDDDPSGIATYSQAGAQFGYSLGWTLLLSFPLMVALQEACARLGRITGKGLATNIAESFLRPVGYTIAALLLVANVINLAADLGAMAAALRLLVAGPHEVYVIGFAIACGGLITFVPYERYSSYLKWLCLSVFAYAGTLFAVHVPWGEVAVELVWPRLQAHTDYITAAVAIIGTTISPYLFFWQASQEAEREREDPKMKPLVEAPRQAGLACKPAKAKTFYGVIAAAMIVGIGLNAVSIDPIKALFWSAVINGLVAVPIMALIMMLSRRRAVVGEFRLPKGLAILGWIATGFMALIAAAMVWTWVA